MLNSEKLTNLTKEASIFQIFLRFCKAQTSVQIKYELSQVDGRYLCLISHFMQFITNQSCNNYLNKGNIKVQA